MVKPKFTAVFDQKIKISRIPKESYAYAKQALASGNDGLKQILPKFDKDKNPDLLAVAFDLAIANIVNANDDGILTPTAKLIAPNFVFKPLNIEHDRYYVIGTVTTSSLTSFTDGSVVEPSSIDDKSLDPFKISVGGVLWRCVNGYMAEMIEDQNEQAMSDYPYCCEYAGSWEVGFDEYVVALGSKKLSDAEIVTDDTRVKELSQYLRANGGNGMLPDGTPIYRVITGEVTSLGVGITTNPAAAVDKIFADAECDKKNKEIISSKSSKSVNLNTKKIMKIKSINDITEDVVKEAHASEICDFIKSEIVKKDEELNRSKEEATATKTKVTEAEAKVKSLEDQIVVLNSEVKSLKDEKLAKEAEDTFNTRMNTLASKYELNSDLEKIVHSQIKGLDQEAFAKWEKDFSVLASSFKKEEKKPETDPEAAGKVIATASVKGATPPNTPTVAGKVWEKFKPEVKFTKNTVTL